MKNDYTKNLIKKNSEKQTMERISFLQEKNQSLLTAIKSLKIKTEQIYDMIPQMMSKELCEVYSNIHLRRTLKMEKEATEIGFSLYNVFSRRLEDSRNEMIKRRKESELLNDEVNALIDSFNKMCCKYENMLKEKQEKIYKFETKRKADQEILKLKIDRLIQLTNNHKEDYYKMCVEFLLLHSDCEKQEKILQKMLKHLEAT